MQQSRLSLFFWICKVKEENEVGCNWDSLNSCPISVSLRLLEGCRPENLSTSIVTNSHSCLGCPSAKVSLTEKKKDLLKGKYALSNASKPASSRCLASKASKESRHNRLNKKATTTRSAVEEAFDNMCEALNPRNWHLPVDRFISAPWNRPPETSIPQCYLSNQPLPHMRFESMMDLISLQALLLNARHHSSSVQHQ